MRITKDLASIWRDYAFIIVPVAVLSGLTNGIMQAISDDPEHGFLLEFLAGLATGPLYLVLGILTLLSVLYAAVPVTEFPHRRSRYSYPDPSPLHFAAGFAFGMLVTAVWAVPTYWLLSVIPVVGDQIDRMAG